MLDPDSAQVTRSAPLQPLNARAVSPAVQILQARYHRAIPPHYQGNPLTRQRIDIRVILAPGGSLIVPGEPQTNFLPFYEALRKTDPGLFQQILSPSGTAKAASTSQVTPIKAITQMHLASLHFPGEAEFYGWHALQKEVVQKGVRLELLFQGNGLYFNRGSAFFDGQNLQAYPDDYLAELLEKELSPETRERLAIDEKRLKRPSLWFLSLENRQMSAYIHRFQQDETYRQGIERLEENFRRLQVRAALAASPPLVVPDENRQPVYLSLPEIIAGYHANDVRHYLYCPYQGAVLLSAELGRVQCLQPDELAKSISTTGQARLRLKLAETLNFVPAAGLASVLDQKGYAGRYELDIPRDSGSSHLSINPLEGVYSHLVIFLTHQGQFGLIQTSGTRSNITGNDGPTLRQLSAILRDLNTQAPFVHDPIMAAASGSQGNDVPNVVCRSRAGDPDLLFKLAPAAGLDEAPFLRGMVTTPRVGIGFID